jgi:lipopolysaccharide export system protein LptC
MIDRNVIWLPMVILALLAVLSFWIEQSIQGGLDSNRSNPNEPNSIIENFKASSTDEAGIPRYRLTAAKLSHFPSNDSTLLEKPQFTHLHATQGEMIVSAQRAQVGPEGEEVIFSDNVSLRRLSSGNRAALSLKSQTLKVYPDKEQIVAPQHVTITAPGLQLTAAGMQLSGKTRILKLHGRVKAEFKNAPRT